MKLFIDTTDVLRDTFWKAEQIYNKFYIDEFSDENTMTLKNDEWEKEESNDNFKYELNLPITSFNLIDHFKFPSNEDLFNFFYVEFPMQIFGSSPSVKPETFKILNELYEDIRETIDITIISDEIQKSKPATLFFLSKYGCLIENIRFYSDITIENVINECDVIVTANPNIFNKIIDKNKVIKVKTTYNNSYEFNHNIDSIEELKDTLKKLNIL